MECAVEAESSQNLLESKLFDLACDLVKGLVPVASLKKKNLFMNRLENAENLHKKYKKRGHQFVTYGSNCK